jgi:hypothetical protein
MNIKTNKVGKISKTYFEKSVFDWSAGSEALTTLDSSRTGVVSSNPFRGVYICSLFSASCCPLSVETLDLGRSSFRGDITECLRGGWVGPTVVLDAVVKRKNSQSPPEIEP